MHTYICLRLHPLNAHRVGQVLAHQESLCPSDGDSPLQLLLAYSLVHAFAAEINKNVTTPIYRTSIKVHEPSVASVHILKQ